MINAAGANPWRERGSGTSGSSSPLPSRCFTAPSWLPTVPMGDGTPRPRLWVSHGTETAYAALWGTRQHELRRQTFDAGNDGHVGRGELGVHDHNAPVVKRRPPDRHDRRNRWPNMACRAPRSSD
jgi:hypothetical protein